MDKRSVLFIGGDERQLHCAKYLYDVGYETAVYGFDKCTSVPRGIAVYTNLKIAVVLADVVVLPTPFSVDSRLFAPLSEEPIQKEEVLKYLDSNKIVFGGKFDIAFQSALARGNIEYHDFLEEESVVLQNACFTAEGTVDLMMRSTDEALFGKKVLILGCGRIAKLLARMLSAFKMNITLAARKKADLTLIKLSGFHAKPIAPATDIAPFDFVINTVPVAILQAQSVNNYSGVFIDLAPAYETKADTYRAARGVPGTYAPASAGMACGACLLETLSEVRHE